VKLKSVFVFFLILIYSGAGLLPQKTLWAQTPGGMTSTQFDTTDFPLWAKDLRRAEIIAFGTYPFVFFVTNWGLDTYRSRTSGAPKTQDDKITTLFAAAGGAVFLALVDHIIVRYKRNLLEKENKSILEETPIIIQTPLYADKEGPAPERPAPPQNPEGKRPER
jgi:hypothetical protein